MAEYWHGAREAIYADTTFRSTLEARWAKCFDLLGIAWRYEPETFRFQWGHTRVSYCPDFLLAGCLYVEVKPRLDEAEWQAIEGDTVRKWDAFVTADRPLVVLWGAPVARWYPIHFRNLREPTSVVREYVDLSQLAGIGPGYSHPNPKKPPAPLHNESAFKAATAEARAAFRQRGSA